MKIYDFDGSRVSDLRSFYDEFAKAIGVKYFGKTFRGFEDCLWGGFGLEVPCRIRWHHSALSEKILDERCYLDECRKGLFRNDFLDEQHRENVLGSIREAERNPKTQQQEFLDLFDFVCQHSDGKIHIEVELL